MNKKNLTTVEGGIYNMEGGSVANAPSTDLDIVNKKYADEELKNYKKSRIGIIELFSVNVPTPNGYAEGGALKLASDYPDAALLLGSNYKAYGALDLSHLTSNTSDPEFQISIVRSGSVTPAIQNTLDNAYKMFNGEGLTFDNSVVGRFDVVITGEKAKLMTETLNRGSISSMDDYKKGLAIEFRATLSGSHTGNIGFQIQNFLGQLDPPYYPASSSDSSVQGRPSENANIFQNYYLVSQSGGGTIPHTNNKFSFMLALNAIGGSAGLIVLNNVKINIIGTNYNDGILYLDIPRILHPVTQDYSRNDDLKALMYIGEKITS